MAQLTKRTISSEDAADIFLPDLLLDREPGYDGWLFDKVSTTANRVEAGNTGLTSHDEAIQQVRARLAADFGERSE